MILPDKTGHTRSKYMQSDYWNDDDFEETVAAALIATYETKIHKAKGCHPKDRLDNESVTLFRRSGPYIVSNSRLFEVPAQDDESTRTYCFDVQNDPLPAWGCCGYKPSGTHGRSNQYEGYFLAHYVRQVPRLPKGWQKIGTGHIYEYFVMCAQNNGIHGERHFLTVSKRGEVMACDRPMANIAGSMPGRPVEMLSFAKCEPNILRERAAWGSFALQAIADQRFCWTIDAKEKDARARLGCMPSEIKSLLYARSLPLTATGRKRPVLHLVAAHKRRIKEGIDVDVTEYLRGQQTIEIGGTQFTIRPPASIRDQLSERSQAKYY